MKFKNQMEAVKWHLENKHKLSSLQAFRLYGITRLSDKIFKLRKSGWDIQSEKSKLKIDMELLANILIILRSPFTVLI